MRTTVDLDPHLLKRFRAEAHERGVPLKELLTTVLQRGLAEQTARSRARYRCPTFAMGAVAAGVDIDRALHLAHALEEAETGHKQSQRRSGESSGKDRWLRVGPRALNSSSYALNAMDRNR